MRRLMSADGFTAVAHVFVMEWAAILRDLVVGLLIAGAVAAWVPDSFWQALFFDGHPLAAKLWGPLIGPLVAIASFVCSVGNVPLAVVLWKGGISFGGVIAFIFADLLILPILNIYRKYYGRRMAGVPARHLLRGHGRRRIRRGAGLRRPRGRPGPVPTRRLPEERHHLELHDLAQHRLPRPGRGAGGAVRAHWRHRDARA